MRNTVLKLIVLSLFLTRQLPAPVFDYEVLSDQGLPNASNAQGWPIKITDGTDILATPTHPVRTDPTGTTNQPVTASSWPLPTGAATAARQDTGNTSLASIDLKLTNPLPVSVSSLPLPSGASTAARQDTGNTSLSSIDTKLTNPLPVSVASLPLPSGASTAARQDTGNTSLASIDTKLTNPLPVSAASLPLPSGAATGSKQDTGNTSLASIDTKLTNPLPVSLSGNQAVNVAQVAGSTVATGNGAPGAGGVQRVALAYDSTVTPYPVLPSMPDATGATGSLTFAGQTTVMGPTAFGSVISYISGVWVGTVVFEGSADGVTYDNLSYILLPFTWSTGAAISSAAATANGTYLIIGTGYRYVRTKFATRTSGTVTVQMVESTGSSPVYAVSATDTNFLAKVTQGTAASAANAWNMKITDGTNTGAVKAASTPAAATDPSQVVSLSPNNPIPTGSNTIGALTANQSVNVSQINAATPLMGNGTTGTGSQRVTIASDNTAFSVNATPPTLTKSSQGATGYSVQELINAGRTAIVFYANTVNSGTTTTETAITMTKSSGVAATSSAASFVVTSGKKFRITSIMCGTRSVSAVAQQSIFNFRVNTAGGVTTSSTPLVLTCTVATPATALSWDRDFATIPEGYEIAGDGTLQIGMTANAVFASGTAPQWYVRIVGYEY